MSSQFGFIDIILLAMFAGFIILRLRNILGRKTGHQRKSINRYFPKGVEVLKDILNVEPEDVYCIFRESPAHNHYTVGEPLPDWVPADK